jgi:hypothetical protein
MDEDPGKQALQNALNKWQKKYRIGKDDPLFMTVELWQILFENSKAEDSYRRFRLELEQLTQISKTFSKQSSELTAELRTVPKIKNDLWLFPYFTVVLAIVAALIIGFFIGRYFFHP